MSIIQTKASRKTNNQCETEICRNLIRYFLCGALMSNHLPWIITITSPYVMVHVIIVQLNCECNWMSNYLVKSDETVR